MSRSVIATAATVAALLVSSVAADAASMAAPKPAMRPVALACAASKGDVAQTLTITNKGKTTVPAGTKVSWSVNGKTGTTILILPLAAGKSTVVLAPPGNGGKCTATYVPK